MVSFNDVEWFSEDEIEPDWAVGLPRDKVERIIKAAELCQKADWEGGFEEVAFGWPSMFPEHMQDDVNEFNAAHVKFLTKINLYLAKVGVEY